MVRICIKRLQTDRSDELIKAIRPREARVDEQIAR